VKDVILAIGGAGGSRITTAVAQVLLGVLDGLSVHDAVLRPRLHHQLFPNTLFLEPHTHPSIIERMKAYGHAVEVQPPEQHLAVVSAVAKDGAWMEGVGDPRNLDAGAAGGMVDSEPSR